MNHGKLHECTPGIASAGSMRAVSTERTPVSRGRASTLCTTVVPPSLLTPPLPSHATSNWPSAVTARTCAGCQWPALSRARHGNPSAQPIGALPSSADRAFAALIWSRTCTGSAPAAPPLLASKRDLRLRLEGPASAASSPATPCAALPSACASSRSAASVSAMAYMQRKHGTSPARHTDTQRFECMHIAQAVTCRQCNMHTQRTGVLPVRQRSLQCGAMDNSAASPHVCILAFTQQIHTSCTSLNRLW